MIVIGLTGSIGMGKSTAASMLKKLGLPVHDSDRAVHVALSSGGAAVADVAKHFPGVYDKSEDRIDRKKLGGIVFADPAKLKKLESIVHPIVWKSQRRFISVMTRQGKRAVVLEIPLLFETGAEERVDATICVTAPPAIQKRRVLRRKNMDAEKFQRILQQQMPDVEKRARADFTVQTGMGYATTFRQLRQVVKVLTAGGKAFRK